MDELFAQLKDASVGNGELSWAIAKALGWTSYWSGQTVYLPPGEVEGSYEGRTEAPRFTTSVDAALTLVPEGIWLNLNQFGLTTPDGSYMVELIKGGHKDDPQLGEKIGWGCSHSIPLAVCIAALKAKHAVKD